MPDSLLLKAALKYAQTLQWKVLPLKGKIPLTKHGSADASTDEAQIRDWWRKWPDANIGVSTGEQIFVLDVDTKTGGDLSLEQLVRKHGPLPDTRQQQTPTGGRHYVFRAPDFPVSNSQSMLAPGLDIRGVGGYIVAAPSLHPATGRPYVWDGLDPLEKQPLCEAPAWLLQALKNGLRCHNGLQRLVPNKIPKGQQHSYLVSVAGSMRARGLEFPEIFAALRVINRTRCTEPGPEKNIRQIAESVARYAPGAPHGSLAPPLAPAPGKVTQGDVGDMAPPASPDIGLRFHPYTDSGNAERLATRFAGQFRYCGPHGFWYLWTGRRWESDQSGKMLLRTKLIARELYDEAAHIEAEDQRQKCAAWARKSEFADRRRAALFLAQAEPGVPILPSEMDGDPFLLNCLNGTVNLTTGELREHRREDLITRLAPVIYDPGARSDLWDRFLKESAGSDHALCDFLQRAAGYSLTGSVREEVLFFVHGPGAAGKSTFLEALKAALGDYAKVADFESFILHRHASTVRNDIAELAGRRFVVSIEVAEGQSLAEGLIKWLTGGDSVRARFLYREAFDFMPQFKLWLAANHKPSVRHDDSAMWRRILRVPFEYVVPKAKRDPTLKARLRDPAISGPAILAWAVEGCLRWQEDGLQVPEVVKQATEQYRLDMDSVREFLEECCQFDAEARCSSAHLRTAYAAWAKAGKRPVSSEFASQLAERGCTKIRMHGGVRGWQGVRLVSGEEETKDAG
jgi:putative DNA primase/helicase